MFMTQLGYPDAVPAAARVTLREPIESRSRTGPGHERRAGKGEAVMLVEDVGPGFEIYDPMGPRRGEILASLPETFRVSAALTHFLSWQIDGNRSNTLIRLHPDRGPTADDVRLIDHDVALGIRHSGPKLHGSIFAPGKWLAYTSPQRHLRDLPVPDQRLVRDLAAASIEEIAAVYDLDPIEASWTHGAARLVAEHGLTEAFRRFYADGQKYRDPGFHARGDTLLELTPFDPPRAAPPRPPVERHVEDLPR